MESDSENLIDYALVPVRAALSKPAQRAYISTALTIVTSTLLLGLAVLAYILFYFNFIPQIGLERVVHLQFGDGHPRGLASLGDGLVSSQAYDVTVHLDLPRSPPNLATGNFMLDLSLVSSAPATLLWTPTDQDVLAHSRRPAILTYESPLVNTIKTTGGALWLFLGWKKEAESIDVPMLESVEFTRGWRTIPKFLRLEIQADEKMMVYKARVSFKARFSGLRWIMYNHRIISLVTFSTIFWITELLSAGVAWYFFSSYLLPTSSPTSIKPEPDSSSPIKAEGDGTESDTNLGPPSDLSDTPRDFPTYSRQPPLRYTGKASIKKEEDDNDKDDDMATKVAATTRIQPLANLRKTDDEDEDDEADLVDVGSAMRSTKTDSGIGTSLDEGRGGAAAGAGLQRRRSSGKGARGN